MTNIYKYCAANNIDVVNMIPPQPHVARSKQTRIDPVSGEEVKGRALNFTIPIAYPRRSFQAGQSSPSAPAGDLTVLFQNGNEIVASAGRFNDWSLYAGAVISIQSPSLGAVTNGGYYRIASISPDYSTLVIDNEVIIGAYDKTIGAAVAFEDASLNVTIWRVAIDPFTELQPSFTEAFNFVEIDGAPVEVSVRASLVSQDIRVNAAVSLFKVSVVDAEAYYLRAVKNNGEDRYYVPGEVVHWNSVCANEVIAPAFRDFCKSLSGGISRGVVSTPAPQYVPYLAIRPDAGALQTTADLNINRAVDIQMKQGESMVIRSPSGAIVAEFKQDGSFISNCSAGLPFKRVPIVAIGANLEPSRPLEAEITIQGGFSGYVHGQQNGVGRQMTRIVGVYDGSSIAINTTKEVATGGDVFTVSTSGNKIVVTPVAANSQLWVDVICSPTTYGSYEY